MFFWNWVVYSWTGFSEGSFSSKEMFSASSPFPRYQSWSCLSCACWPVRMKPSWTSMESPQMLGPTIERTAAPSLRSQTLTFLSQPPETTRFGSSYTNLAQKTRFEWPGSPEPPPARVVLSCLVYSSYTLTLPSSPPVRNSMPSGL